MAAAALLIRLGVDSKGVNAGVDAAVRELDKLKASAANLATGLGAAFPKSVGTEAKNIAGAVGSLAGAFGGLGGVLGTLAIGTVVDDFLDTASSLSDLSSQTDITIKDLQRFKYAGEQVGVGLDAIATAVGQLQNRLGSGDKSAFAALDQLGLSIQNLKRLDPGQQFETIATAISRIPDPSQRAAVAMDLFGRAGVSLLPLLRSNIKDIGDQMFVMSDRTVEAADKFGDLLNTVTTFGKAIIGETVLGPIVRWATETQEAIADVRRSFETLTGAAEKLPEVLSKPLTGKGFQGPKLSFEEAMKVSDELDRKLEQQHNKRIADSRRVAEQIKRDEEKNTEATLKYYEETRRVFEVYTDIIIEANAQIADVSGLSSRSKVEQTILDGLVDQWQIYADAIDSVNQLVRIGLDSAPGFQISPEALGGDWAKKAGATAGFDFGREFSRTLIGAIQGGGGVGASIGAFIGDKLGADIGKRLASAVGSKFGSALGGLLGPLGAVGGSLLGGLVDKIFKNEGKRVNDLRDEFISQFGSGGTGAGSGFQNLAIQLRQTGDEGDALFHRLQNAATESDFKRTVEDINDALREQRDIMADSVPTFGDVTAAAERYGISVDKLGNSVQGLRLSEVAKQAVKDWDLFVKTSSNLDEVIAGMSDEMNTLVKESEKFGAPLDRQLRPILDKMAEMGLLTNEAGEKLTDLDSLNWEEPLSKSISNLKDSMKELAGVIRDELGGALRGLPALNLGSGSVPSGGSFTPPSPASAETNVNLYLDGYQIAEAVVPHFPNAVARMA